MTITVPVVDVSAAKAKVTRIRTRSRVTGPVVADSAAVREGTGIPAEVPALEEGERRIFYQSS